MTKWIEKGSKKNEGKMENGETCKEDTRFWLTYIKGLELFVIEGEGHGERQLLR